MDLVGVLVLTVVLGTLLALGFGAIARVCWARRTGRCPWLWALGAYIAANIVWAILRPYLTQP
jgi:hypothetical protein